MLRIHFERTRRGVSQTAIAVAAHIPQPTVSQIERGRLQPTPAQLDRLARVFRLEPEDLLREVRPE